MLGAWPRRRRRGRRAASHDTRNRRPPSNREQRRYGPARTRRGHGAVRVAGHPVTLWMPGPCKAAGLPHPARPSADAPAVRIVGAGGRAERPPPRRRRPRCGGSARRRGEARGSGRAPRWRFHRGGSPITAAVAVGMAADSCKSNKERTKGQQARVSIGRVCRRDEFSVPYSVEHRVNAAIRWPGQCWKRMDANPTLSPSALSSRSGRSPRSAMNEQARVGGGKGGQQIQLSETRRPRLHHNWPAGSAS